MPTVAEELAGLLDHLRAEDQVLVLDYARNLGAPAPRHPYHPPHAAAARHADPRPRALRPFRAE